MRLSDKTAISTTNTSKTEKKIRHFLKNEQANEQTNESNSDELK